MLYVFLTKRIASPPFCERYTGKFSILLKQNTYFLLNTSAVHERSERGPFSFKHECQKGAVRERSKRGSNSSAKNVASTSEAREDHFLLSTSARKVPSASEAKEDQICSAINFFLSKTTF